MAGLLLVVRRASVQNDIHNVSGPQITCGKPLAKVKNCLFLVKTVNNSKTKINLVKKLVYHMIVSN